MPKLTRKPVSGSGALAPALDDPPRVQPAHDPLEQPAQSPSAPPAPKPPGRDRSPGDAPQGGPAQQERMDWEKGDSTGARSLPGGTGTEVPGAPPARPAQRPAPETTRRSSRRRHASQADPADLWRQVLTVCESAKRNSTGWTGYSPNLPQSMWTAVNGWLLRASRESGHRGLAANHLIEVAFDRLPRDTSGYIDGEEAAALARAWLEAHPDPPPRVSTGSRLTSATANRMMDLSRQLKMMKQGLDVWMAQAAAIQQFLDAFDGADFPS